MDSIDFDNVKAEKLKALQRFNRFRTIARFFRVMEIFVALLFITWTLTRLPFFLQISGEFLRRIGTVISTPLFVFLLGNSIIVVLLTKSSDQSTTNVVITNAENEIYQAFVRSVENRSKPSDENVTEEIVANSNLIAEEIVANSNSNPIAEEIVANSNSNSNPIVDENIPEIDRDLTSDSISDQLKIYGRSKSDVSAKQSSSMKRSLQRSETEKKCREIEDENKNYPEDDLSNEEFQKTIEDFIAKQLMFRRQESLAVVVHNKA